MVLWHEGARGRRCQQRASAHRGGPSATSWHGSPGPCWHKSAAMKRALRQPGPEMDTLRFTMGRAAALDSGHGLATTTAKPPCQVGW